MEPKRTKYDTNPLDGKVADHASKSFESPPSSPTEEVRGGPTRDIGRTANETARANRESEAPTRRIDDNIAASYPSVFIPPPARSANAYREPPAPAVNIYQPPPVPPSNIYLPPPAPVTFKQGSHSVAGLGISEK